MSLPPICDVFDSVCDALNRAPQVLLHAPTGAGKSTWLPLQLLLSGQFSGRIIMLEPRRLAAKNVAMRLAEQLGEKVGDRVGYRMRGDSKVSNNTQLEVVTEGILTRLLQCDAELNGVSLIILDEFHERSLNSDLALALLLDVQQGLRDDLKLLIMSATLEGDALTQLLPNAISVRSEGRSFPVERHYIAPSTSRGIAPHLDQLVANQAVAMLQQYQGSLLVFLPGVSEIHKVAQRLKEALSQDVDICPLYGALSLTEQQKAISPAATGRRKVVLATNIAETSLTIDGISLVLDSALERTTRFDVKSGVTRLITQTISKAAMAQRAGRAGRLSSGICWHLLVKEQAQRAREFSEAEILSCDLSSLAFELSQWGCHDITQLSWLDLPPQPALSKGRLLLKQLGAIDDNGRLTPVGQQMALLGCDPRLAAMLVHGKKQGEAALHCAALLAAIIEEPSRQAGLDIERSLLDPDTKWILRTNRLLHRLGCKTKLPTQVDISWAMSCLLSAYVDCIGQKRPLTTNQEADRYLLANGMGVSLGRGEVGFPQNGIIAPLLLHIESNNASLQDARVLLALPIDLLALEKEQPQLISHQSTLKWDAEKGCLRAEERHCIGEIVLRKQPLASPSDKEMKTALLYWLAREGFEQLPWHNGAEQLRLRVKLAQQYLPQLTWPDFSELALKESLETWLGPRLNKVRDLKAIQSINLVDALSCLLDWQQKQWLDSELPTHYKVPTGSKIPLTYFADKPPLLSVRMQEMFGEQHSPRIAQGKLTVVLSLLSPAHRPLQITQDLAAFWQGAYVEVKKEMKGRYPKHPWPDDPANALPTNRVKKKQ